MEPTDGGVAARLAEARKLAGLTQLQLAQRANLSVSLVRKVERGSVPASPTFIASTARALGLMVTDLTEERDFRSVHSRFGIEQRFVPDLERAIIEHDDVPTGELLLELPEIEQRIITITEAGRVSNYTKALELLPRVIRSLHGQASQAPAGKIEAINRLLAQVYYSAMFASYKFGHLSLSAWAAERMATSAHQSGDPLWDAMGKYGRSQGLMFSGS